MLCHRHYRRRSRRWALRKQGRVWNLNRLTIQPYQVSSRRGNTRISRQNTRFSLHLESGLQKQNSPPPLFPFRNEPDPKGPFLTVQFPILSAHLHRIFHPAFHSTSANFSSVPTKWGKTSPRRESFRPSSRFFLVNFQFLFRLNFLLHRKNPFSQFPFSSHFHTQSTGT